MPTDKLNRVDYRWFVVRTQPRQERMLANMLTKQQETTKNILEVYYPTHTAVKVQHDGKEEHTHLFTGFVFVLATRQAIAEFIQRHFPECVMLYDYSQKTRQHKAELLTIPEEQMRTFMDFNENYANQMVILERPFSDYAFNPKTGEPNEIVRVIDGPLKGREGYIARFRRDKRLVFQMRGFEKNSYLTISLPHIWDFHVVRLHNAEGDRLSIGTEKGRAVDLLIGILQACGYHERTLAMFYDMTDRLSVKPSLIALCQALYKQGEKNLSRRLAQISAKDAELILNLIRYEHDNPGYVKANWNKLSLRPFLTPTPGLQIGEGKDEAELPHKDFTEIIRKVDITEDIYYPSQGKDRSVTTTYYAHTGIKNGVLFTNWDTFLHEYFLTAGKANEKLVGGTVQSRTESGQKEKLIESFRNYAPTLYKVLTDKSQKVKALQGFRVGNETWNVFAITATADNAKNELINTCLTICKEINTTTHLAAWRRYLRTVWLHT